MECYNLPQDRNQLWVLVNMVMKLQAPYNVGKYLHQLKNYDLLYDLGVSHTVSYLTRKDNYFTAGVFIFNSSNYFLFISIEVSQSKLTAYLFHHILTL